MRLPFITSPISGEYTFSQLNCGSDLGSDPWVIRVPYLIEADKICLKATTTAAAAAVSLISVHSKAVQSLLQQEASFGFFISEMKL